MPTSKKVCNTIESFDNNVTNPTSHTKKGTNSMKNNTSTTTAAISNSDSIDVQSNAQASEAVFKALNRPYYFADENFERADAPENIHFLIVEGEKSGAVIGTRQNASWLYRKIYGLGQDRFWTEWTTTCHRVTRGVAKNLPAGWSQSPVTHWTFNVLRDEAGVWHYDSTKAAPVSSSEQTFHELVNCLLENKAIVLPLRGWNVAYIEAVEETLESDAPLTTFVKKVADARERKEEYAVTKDIRALHVQEEEEEEPVAEKDLSVIRVLSDNGAYETLTFAEARGRSIKRLVGDTKAFKVPTLAGTTLADRMSELTQKYDFVWA